MSKGCEADQPFDTDVFSSTYKDDDIKLVTEKTVKKLANGWKTVKGTRVMKHNTGKYHYRIKIDSHNRNNNPYLMIGVSSCQKVLGYSNGVVFSGNNTGSRTGKYKKGSSTQYGNNVAIVPGDVVHLIIDTDKKSISVSLNEKDLGVLDNDLINNCVLSVDLYSTNDQVTIL
ncbi:neuralized [Anaeramoeba flamelloides]|uniref:Neuralized n=1 Tax=Anaeramoeba flamelloides TaxID=1746091 RepID=A0ABQ8Z2U7_9EUKA|nr:neuralized [Anaeramoeba flamelloides]